MWAVIKKEFKSYFYTPIGYIFIGVFLIAFSISFYFSVIGYGNVNFEYIYYTLPTILVLAFIIFLLGLFTSNTIPRYECTIDSNVSFVELYEKYNVIEQRGNIWVLEEKTSGDK